MRDGFGQVSRPPISAYAPFMELSETDRNRLLLWLRWDITFDWFGYPPPMKRVHITLLAHPEPWSTRALAKHTNLPQTTVRRQIDAIARGRQIERSEKGVQLNQIGFLFGATFHAALVKYVRGGCHLDPELVALLKQAPETGHMDFEMMETHVWRPVIDAPDIADA